MTCGSREWLESELSVRGAPLPVSAHRGATQDCGPVTFDAEQSRTEVSSPTRARPEGFEPPTNRFVNCVPGCALTYRFCAWRGWSRTGAYRVVAG